MEILERIPEDIRIYIQDIAEKMLQGRAAVMVGSGFSKNSKNNRYTEKKFLDWNQLGDIFYKKLYRKLPSEEKYPCYYQDVLKLAGKVQQCFGRTALDKLLLDNLPDEEYEPSELHEALLKLNWTDIFTTNYDTLLERTRGKVFNNRYQVVLSKEDLVYSKCPRIIKLHGSFPSTRPFIVTEEDYRRYPQDFAVFVNTVRQALIENVMCMIGFSGDDPNFLNWIGWIRDYLGSDSASKIYMIGVFDIKETEQKLYDSRNIRLIDMKKCVGIKSGKYEDGLKLFFEALEFFQNGNDEKRFFENKGEDVNIGDIYYESVLKLRKPSLNSIKEVNENIRKIINEWKTERREDIDWFIVPYQQRKEMEKTMEWGGGLVEILYTSEVYEQMLDTFGEFLFEYNYRRNRCLLPLKRCRAEIYEKYLDRISEKWKNDDLELCFSLLEYWREHGMFDKWEKMESKLEYIADDIQKKRLYCEKASKMLYNLECSDLANILIDLSSTSYRIGLEFRISSLLAELGYYERAILLLKKNLDEVRKQMGNNLDYRNYSREAYLIDLLENMEKYYDHLENKTDISTDTDSYSRLKMLKSYDCNPEYEKDYLIRQIIFCVYSENETAQYRLIEGAEPEKFIKFMERTGMVFRTAYFFRYTDEFPYILKGLTSTNPYLALLCTFRYGDKAVCRRIWDQESLDSMKSDKADELIQYCIGACRKNDEYLRSGEVKPNNLAANLQELTPHILVGLLQKASVDVSYEVMDFIIWLLNRPTSTHFSGIKEMMKAAVLRLAELKASNLVCRLIHFPLGCREEKNSKEILEPFLYIDPAMPDTDTPTEEQIAELQEFIKPDIDENCRRAAYVRLLLIEILCKNGIETRILKEVKSIQATWSPEISDLIAYCEVQQGDEKKRNQAKCEWMAQFQEQIRKLSKKGSSYKADFQKETEKLLRKIRFYNKKCSGFRWNVEEINQIIEIMDNWVETIQSMMQFSYEESVYYHVWCMMETILVEIMLGNGMNLEINSLKLGSLEKNLKKLEIPFLLPQIVGNKADRISEEGYRILLEACMKGGRAKKDAEKLFLLYTSKE